MLGLVGGTLYFGHLCRNVPPLPSSTAQFISAKTFSMLGVWLLETSRADWAEATIAAILEHVCGSLGGMGLYFAMLVRGSAARVSANFYVAPGTAALLAWLLPGERLGKLAGVGLLVASGGCWLVGSVPRRRGIDLPPRRHSLEGGHLTLLSAQLLCPDLTQKNLLCVTF